MALSVSACYNANKSVLMFCKRCNTQLTTISLFICGWPAPFQSQTAGRTRRACRHSSWTCWQPLELLWYPLVCQSLCRVEGRSKLVACGSTSLGDWRCDRKHSLYDRERRIEPRPQENTRALQGMQPNVEHYCFYSGPNSCRRSLTDTSPSAAIGRHCTWQVLLHEDTQSRVMTHC